MLETIDNNIKACEKLAIEPILMLFGVPKNASEGEMSIDDFLKKDNIVIYLPKGVYDSIDFSELKIPTKVKFMGDGLSENCLICGFDNFSREILKFYVEPDFNRPTLMFGEAYAPIDPEVQRVFRKGFEDLQYGLPVPPIKISL